MEANTHTRFYVKLLTGSNTTPTTATAAADELDYAVRVRKALSGFDFRQITYTGTSLRLRVYQYIIIMVLRALALM